MTDELVSEWEERHPDLAVGMESAYGPSAGQSYAAAIEEAGSINPDDVNAALGDINIETVMGPTEFHETGWNLHQYEYESVRQWQNEERVLLAPTEFSDGDPWLPTPEWSERTDAPSN
jgi:ABC-type branched-subunit amino acid transport system substrate-binding protein